MELVQILFVSALCTQLMFNGECIYVDTQELMHQSNRDISINDIGFDIEVPSYMLNSKHILGY